MYQIVVQNGQITSGQITERRSGRDRRSGKDRRKASPKSLKVLSTLQRRVNGERRQQVRRAENIPFQD